MPRKTTAAAKLGTRQTSVGVPYDFMVLIGRFRFFDLGDLAAVRQGLTLGRHLVILVESSRQARSLHNPLTFEEVRQTILDALDSTEQTRLSSAPLMDTYNDLEWRANAQAAVRGITCEIHSPDSNARPRICLLAYPKDRRGSYAGRFPQWPTERFPDYQAIDAAAIREDYFTDPEMALGKWASQLPESMTAYLRGFAKTEAYAELAEEARYIADYKRQWAGAPYPPTFVTVDAVLVQSGHILLIERRNHPGKGLFALPGGFLDQHERIREAMLRELREETRLQLPIGLLEGSIRTVQIFDDPYRSARGRTITHAFLIILADGPSGLPKVRGGDDARQAFWMPIGEMSPEMMFEDHWQIIQKMLALVSNDQSLTGDLR